nr:MAG TPA: Minor structural protein 4 [Caudoviricetes sp.]
MYPTNDTYKEKVKELDRVWETKVDIKHEKGTLHLDDKDISLGGMSVTEKTQPGEDFTIGGTVASDLSLKILNRTGGGNLFKPNQRAIDRTNDKEVKISPTSFYITDSWGGYCERIPVGEKEKITISLWYKLRTDTPTNCTIHPIMYDNNGRVGTYAYTVKATSEWQYFEITFETYEKSLEMDLHFISREVDSRVWINGLKIESGEYATPWEDDYSDIDFTGAKIKPYVMLTEDDEGRNLLKRTTDKYQSIDTGTWFNRLNEYPKALNPIEDFGLQVGDTIVYRLYLKTNVDVGAVARLTFYSDDNYSDKTIITGNVISENSEGYSSVVVTLTEKMKYIDVNIQNGKAGEINSNIVEYKKPKLEKGDTATDWRPAVEDWSEPIPLGIFNVDTQSRFRSTIELKAMDNMIKMDRPYSYSKLSYPATLYQIYVDICTICNLLPATHSFLHKDLLIKNRPEGDFSCRDILGFVAQLSGSFAKITRDGKVALKWYEPAGLELGPMNRDDFKPSDEQIAITGVMFKESDEKTYLTGTDDYAIDLTENPLLQQDYSKVLPAILNKIKEIKFNPYTVSKWQGNPAIEAGDMVRHIDVDGNIFDTIITSSTYRYGMKGSMEAKAKSEINKGYKGSTSKKIANVVQKIENNRIEVEDKLTSVEQAQLNAMQLMANMLGGHAIVEGDAFYIADNVDISKAKKVWKWGIGGFAYYPDGLNNPPSTAVTADNSIVAMLVAANIVTADMVRTGILQAEDGNTWINLNNSQFNLADMITWDGKEFKINFTKAGVTLGVANLIRRSKEKQSSEEYFIAAYDLTEDWELDTTYSIAIKGNINDGQQFGIWANGSATKVTTLDYDEATGLYKSTFTTPSTINSREPKTLRVYNFPSSGATSSSIEWIKLEKGTVNTDWTSAQGELDGANYTFDGLNAIFRGAGIKIINAEDYAVMESTVDGLLKIMAQITTGYKEGYNTSMIGNGIYFEARPPSGNKYNVGYLTSGLNPFGATGDMEEGLFLSHNYGRHIAMGGATNKGQPFTYLVLDKENRLGYVPQFPVFFLLNTAFNARTRFYGNMEMYGQAQVYNRITFETGDSAKPSINGYNNWLNLNAYNFSLNGTGGTNARFQYDASTGKSSFFTPLHVNKNFTCSGSKNALQKTENYGERLINAYETAEYFFGDIGSGKLNKEGECIIYIDDTFQECVNTEIEYHVFLQKCGQGDVWIKEKHKTYFIVEGTEGLEFSWELKAKRKGYEYDRLEQPDNYDLGIDDSVSFDRDFEQEDKKDKELEKIYEDELNFDLVNLLLKEVA